MKIPKKYDQLALGYNSRSRVRKATIPAIWAVSKSMRMIVRAYFQSQKYHYQRRCCWPESTNERKYLARSGHRRSSVYQSIKIDVIRSFQLLISTSLLLATSSITVSLWRRLDRQTALKRRIKFEAESELLVMNKVIALWVGDLSDIIFSWDCIVVGVRFDMHFRSRVLDIYTQ